MSKGTRIAVEVGGTFTDVIMVAATDRGCHTRTLKVLSTPRQPERSVLEAFAQLGAALEDLDEFLHGSTVATNTVIERKGARAALLTTKGFRDILEIQRGDKTSIYTLQYRRPQPLVSRDRCLELDERMSARGEVILPLDEGSLARALERLRELGVESVAVSLLNSFANPEHERRVDEAVRAALPGVPVSVSSDLLPQFREYERTSTTVINAYVSPIVDTYLGRLEEQMEAGGFKGSFHIMQSNGGIIPARAARRRAAWMLLSGPAAGIVAALTVSRALGEENIITLDMGGTSTDVSLVMGGKPRLSTEGKVGGLALGIPTLEIVSVGAGGGSIAWQDRGGLLRVGPQSAGADPGPACYGRGGTEPTVTDAQVVRGIIRETQFIGGRFTLRHDLAARAIDALGSRLRLDRQRTADAIVKIANNNMIQAVRVVSAERGYDPRDYTLVAFGGAGPLHAADMADELGMRRVMVPRNAGLFSALGLLVSDFKRDYVQTRLQPLSTLTAEDVALQFRQLQEKAAQEFSEFGVPRERVGFSHSLDMRYQGQAFEITVDLPFLSLSSTLSTSLSASFPSSGFSWSIEELERWFERAYMARYGYVPTGMEMEVVTYRLSARCPRDLTADILQAPSDSSLGPPYEGRVFCSGSVVPCAFWQRNGLREGDEVRGAAVIEEDSSACFVPEGWVARVGKLGSLILERSGRE